jgi:regulator of nonsense transcripts 2
LSDVRLICQVCHSASDILCRLSELLYIPLPSLPTTSQKSDSILIGTNTVSHLGDDADDALFTSCGKWEDEEERRFFEDVQDLKDFVPKSVLGIEGDEGDREESDEEKERERVAKEQEEVRKLEEELEGLKLREDGQVVGNGNFVNEKEDEIDTNEDE